MFPSCRNLYVLALGAVPQHAPVTGALVSLAGVSSLHHVLDGISNYRTSGSSESFFFLKLDSNFKPLKEKCFGTATLDECAEVDNSEARALRLQAVLDVMAVCEYIVVTCIRT